jgi:hypothetical protein
MRLFCFVIEKIEIGLKSGPTFSLYSFGVGPVNPQTSQRWQQEQAEKRPERHS